MDIKNNNHTNLWSIYSPDCYGGEIYKVCETMNLDVLRVRETKWVRQPDMWGAWGSPWTGPGSPIQNVKNDPFDVILPLFLYSAHILLYQALLVNSAGQHARGACVCRRLLWNKYSTSVEIRWETILRINVPWDRVLENCHCCKEIGPQKPHTNSSGAQIMDETRSVRSFLHMVTRLRQDSSQTHHILKSC